MKLPVLAIRNYQFTLVVTAILVVMGVSSFLAMPRSEDPQFDFPFAMVTIVYPGTSPKDMETLVVDPVEDIINELDDITELTTNIEDGLAVFNIEFLYGSDPDDKYDEVVAALNRVRDQLPDGITQITTEKISPADVYILQLALQSNTATYKELDYHAEKLETRLEQVAGVKRVDISALPEQQLQIRVDTHRLKELNIALEDVMNTVKHEAKNLPGGHILAGERRFTVKTSGDYSSIKEIERTVVKSGDGQLIYIKDIADVEFGDALPIYQARFQGQKAVFISVMQRKGTNIFTVTTALKKKINAFNQELPKNISTHTVLDQSENVERRLNSFFQSLLQGLILVAILSWLILGARSAFIVILAIPLSFLM